MRSAEMKNSKVTPETVTGGNEVGRANTPFANRNPQSTTDGAKSSNASGKKRTQVAQGGFL